MQWEIFDTAIVNEHQRVDQLFFSCIIVGGLDVIFNHSDSIDVDILTGPWAILEYIMPVFHGMTDGGAFVSAGFPLLVGFPVQREVLYAIDTVFTVFGYLVLCSDRLKGRTSEYGKTDTDAQEDDQ
jgi:hypothetical protein